MDTHHGSPFEDMPLRGEGVCEWGETTRHPHRFRHLFGTPAEGDRYRGFGLSTATQREETLALLAALTQRVHVRKVTEANEDEWANPNIPAGYTYLAQLVGHDLIHTSLAEASLDASHRPLVNVRDSALQLETLFGGGPAFYPSAFRHAGNGPRTELRLLDAPVFQRAMAARHRSVIGRDLPRMDLPRHRFGGDEGAWAGCPDPLIVDARNDDNAVLSQLTAAFSLFHNAILTRLAETADDTLGTRQRGAVAREVTAYAYRSIVRNDLLARLLHPEVWKYYAYCDSPFVETKQSGDADAACVDPDELLRMPLEFAHSASRVGHAMIRPNYRFNRRAARQALRAVLDHAPSRHYWNLPATRQWIADWSLFFFDEGHPEWVNASARLRPHLVHTLQGAFGPGAAGGPTGLFGRDLVRGAASGLRSVNSLCSLLQKRLPAFVSKLSPMLDNNDTRRQHVKSWLESGNPQESPMTPRQIDCVAEDPPLSFYLLLEAELEGNDGTRLGLVGSVIFAEVLFRALELHAKSASAVGRASQSVEHYATKMVFTSEVGGVPTNMHQLLSFTERYLTAEQKEIPFYATAPCQQC